jgi:putative FmdB family regulatory protein
MPIYEFRCYDCGKQFEKLFMGSDDKAELTCPECQSDTLERVVSRTHYAMSVGPGGNQPRISSKSCGDGSNQCMTLDLPGHTK